MLCYINHSRQFILTTVRSVAPLSITGDFGHNPCPQTICAYYDLSITMITAGQVIGAMVMMVVALLANITAFFMSILALSKMEFSVFIAAIVCGVSGTKMAIN